MDARVSGLAVPPLFAPLPIITGGWACVAIDPPLHFATWSAKGQGRAPSRHYRTHSPEEIMTLPLEAILARNAWGFFWWPDPHLPRLIEAMRVLGFEFSAKAFTWIKLKRSLAQARLISSNETENSAAYGRREDHAQELRILLAGQARQAAAA